MLRPSFPRAIHSCWCTLALLALSSTAESRALLQSPLERITTNTSSRGGVDQVHLSILDDQHLVVHWVTPGAVQPARRSLTSTQVTLSQGRSCTGGLIHSKVQFSVDRSFSSFVEAESKVSCYSTRKYQSDLLHHATLGPLQPATTYFYRCGDPLQGWSPTFNFTSPPERGLQSLPYKIGLVGDLGQTKHSATTVRRLQHSTPGLILNMGDLAYADGAQKLWDRFGRMMQNLTSHVPMAVALGNHDFENLQFVSGSKKPAHLSSGLLAYQLRFSSHRSGSHSGLYYSFTVSAAHIVVLATYAPYKRGSPQMAWLDRDLASVDRGVTPWVIVAMHAPWYHSNHNHAWELQAMADAVEPMLYRHHVDVVFAGHVHAYERTARMYRNKLDDCGPYHILVGDGGNKEGLATRWRNPQPVWSKYRAARYGHGLLEISNATHARWGWARNNDAPGEFQDTAWLIRNSSCYAAAQVAGPRADAPAEMAAGTGGRNAAAVASAATAAVAVNGGSADGVVQDGAAFSEAVVADLELHQQ